jgi:hypothetical protein
MEFQLPKTCGVNVNLNNLRGELASQASAILNVNLGTPAGLQEIASSLEGKLTTLKDKVAAQLPEIPQEIKSLKADLNKLAGMAAGSVEALQQQAAIALDYAGIKDLKGFADINLDDLASSVFSISGTFDPCAMTIPDISLTPAGLPIKFPEIPDIGSVTRMVPEIHDQTIVDDLSNAIKDNIPIVSSTSILQSAYTAPEAAETAKETVKITKIAIESNVSTSITGMGDVVKKLPNGEEVVETKSDFVERVKHNSLPVMDEEGIKPTKEDDIETKIANRRADLWGDVAKANFDKTYAPLMRAGCPIGSSGLPDLGCLDTPEEAKARKEREERAEEIRLRFREVRKANSKLPPGERKGHKQLAIEFYALPENQ